MSITTQPYKIDIFHRDEHITFGPRYKGESGKDILAVKIALGILKPIEESENFETTVSYDPNIPLDKQGWFDCSTGLGTDINKAVLFDSTLEDALLSYQISNTFLITSYLFLKYGIVDIMKSFNVKDADRVTRRSMLLVAIDASLALFESELGTLGEATIAIMHGWTPDSRVKNESYKHNSILYSEGDVVIQIVPEFLYRSLLEPSYPQNINALYESGLVVPLSLTQGLSSLRLGRFMNEPGKFKIPSGINWVAPDSALVLDPESSDISSPSFLQTLENLSERATDKNFAFLEYYPVLSGTSVLYQATRSVIDYYIDNNLFARELTPEQLTEAARSALYPDPFSSEEPFIISNTKIGIYIPTDFELDPNKLPNENPETILELEEKALQKVLKSFNKPEVWNFFKLDNEFLASYYSSIVNVNQSPNHAGVFPRKITQRMATTIREITGFDVFEGDTTEFSDFKKLNFWVLSTKKVIDDLDQDSLPMPVQNWREIEGFGQTLPLIKFVKYIAPSLRPGQRYRAYFEVNKSKLDLIVDGDNFKDLPRESTTPDVSEPSDCLNENSEQSEKTYNEYKAHAIKKRREIVRQIRERAQEVDLSRPTTVDLGSFGYLPYIQNFNFNGLSDYQLTQKVVSSLVPTSLLEAGQIEELNELNSLSGENPGSSGSDSANADETNNSLTITFGDLKDRVAEASYDLRECATVIRREGIRFIPGSNFNAENEALRLEQFVADLEDQLILIADDALINILFEKTESLSPGPQNGKIIKDIKVAGESGPEEKSFLTLANKRPRTVNYISNIKKMTSFPKMRSFFRDARNSCQDLGVDVDKMTTFSYVSKYTSGLKIVVDKTDTSIFQSWVDSTENKVKKVWEDTKSNWEDSFDPSNFNSDAALRALGQRCEIRDLYEEVFDKLSLPSLLCDYIKCVRLPPFDVKLPRLNFDPIPTIPIFGWFAGLSEFVNKQFEEIYKRLGCSIAKLLIDKLAFPFCEEQLSEFINTSPQTLPEARKALIDSLVNTGIVAGNEDKAKNFFDAVSGILTGRELCYLLEGQRPDNATMSAINRLAENSEISSDLDTDEKIINFFGILGVYLPPDFCESISRSTTVSPTSCEDTNEYVRSVRNRLTSGDSSLSDEEIDEVVNQIEQQKEEEAQRLKAFLDNGFSGMTPLPFELGNPNAPMSDFPEVLKKEFQLTANDLFSVAESSYVDNLAEYVPAMAISSPSDIRVFDPRYDEAEILKLETLIQCLQNFSSRMQKYFEENPNGNIDNDETSTYGPSARYQDLHELFDTEVITKISARFVPEEIAADLVPLFDEETGEIIEYVIPHSTTRTTFQFIQDFKMYFTNTTNVQGARVHKRRIKLENASDYVSQISAIDAIIRRYNKRVNRTSGGKRRRLVKERRRYIEQRDRLRELQAGEEAQNQPVSHEFYLDYLNRAREEGIPLEERLEFELVPFDSVVTVGLASMTKEYADFSSGIDDSTYNYPSGEEGAHMTRKNGSRVVPTSVIGSIFDDETGLQNVSQLMLQKSRNELIQGRLRYITDEITNILSRRPTIVEDYLLPGVQKMLDSNTEKNLERADRLQNVEQSEDSYKLEFNPSGSVYSPSITMVEYPAKYDKDRYDIIFAGDFFLGQLDKEEKITKKYCEQLPEGWDNPRNTEGQSSNESNQVFGKRIKFKNIIKEDISSHFSDALRGGEYEEFLGDNFFKRITESIFENLLDQVSESDLFNGEYVASLDARVAGKRIIKKNCVSNRFSQGAGSVISFKNIIIDDAAAEVAKELAKPENSPANQDFDSHNGIDKAMQNLGLKAFIRVCLIDTLLKGGLPYSVWDFESVAGVKITNDYIIEHVKNQLNENSDLKDMWGKILERVTGISSRNSALEYFIKQEIVKMPNYSKQIFNPLEGDKDFYNWYLSEDFIPQFYIAAINMDASVDLADERTIQLRRKIGRKRYTIPGDIPEEQFYTFSSGKPSFFIEHYIKIKLDEGHERFLSLAKNYLATTYYYELKEYKSHLIISDSELVEIFNAIKEVSETVEEREEYLKGITIFQSARLCLLDPLTDEDTADGTSVHLEYLRQAVEEDKIEEVSKSTRAFKVAARFSIADPESDEIRPEPRECFSIPLTSFDRELDFEECYNWINEGESYGSIDFRKAADYMRSQLLNTKESKLLFEHIFPIRRFTSIASVYATSVLSGYGSMPSLLADTKSSLASVISVCNLTRRQKDELTLVTQEEFAKQLTENFPTAEDACLEFPDIFGPFWLTFLRELRKLLKKMPSILFRGIANQLDPAYQEMRQHYVNCDIKNLTFRGLRPAGTVDYKLTNGLYLKGRNRGPRTNVEGLEGKGNGKYVPLILGFGSDLGYAFSKLFSQPDLFAERFGISILKLITYIYSGNAPFLDPAMHFKIPCANFNVGAWRDKGKYDAGAFGRYGHPLSPFTYLALATPQLESDKRVRQNNCIEVPEKDCETISADEVIGISEATPSLQSEEPVFGSPRPAQPAFGFQGEDPPFVEDAAPVTGEVTEIDYAEFLFESTERQDIHEVRHQIRVLLYEAFLNSEPLSAENEIRVTELKQQLIDMNALGAPNGVYWDPELSIYREFRPENVMDVVVVYLTGDPNTIPSSADFALKKAFMIPFEIKEYFSFNIHGTYTVQTLEDLENFGK